MGTTMEQSTIDKVALEIKIFGAVLFMVCFVEALCLGEIIWSLTRSLTIDGPLPPQPALMQQYVR